MKATITNGLLEAELNKRIISRFLLFGWVSPKKVLRQLVSAPPCWKKKAVEEVHNLPWLLSDWLYKQPYLVSFAVPLKLIDLGYSVPGKNIWFAPKCKCHQQYSSSLVCMIPNCDLFLFIGISHDLVHQF